MIEIRLNYDQPKRSKFETQFWRPETRTKRHAGFRSVVLTDSKDKYVSIDEVFGKMILDTDALMKHVHQFHGEQFDWCEASGIKFDYVWCGRFFFHTDSEAVAFKLRFK